MAAYYNEHEPYAAAWLRNLIAAGLVPDGDVDERDIRDVPPADLAGYVQCHFFAGLGGWAYAARLAGWPDERQLWTGSCPCQPFSTAGNRRGQADERHLWPEFFRLIRACQPVVVMGEQVAAAVGKHWLDGVFADLEGVGYACGAAVVPACAVDAPHRRDRLWFVADARGGAAQRRGGAGELPGPAGALEGSRNQREWSGRASADRGEGGLRAMGDAGGSRLSDAECEAAGGAWGRGEGRATPESGRASGARPMGHAEEFGPPPRPRFQGDNLGPREPERPSPWGGAGWIMGIDGKARRFEPRVRLLAHGVPARVPKLRALGNAIVPQVAAEVIAAFMECMP